MNILFKKDWQVSFSETDMAGMAHFTHYYKWMETTEHAFLESLKIPVIEQNKDILRGWPRVDAYCTFLSPLYFGDHVQIHLSIEDVNHKKIQYGFYFMQKTPEGEKMVAQGKMTTIYAEVNVETHKVVSKEISKSILEKIIGDLT